MSTQISKETLDKYHKLQQSFREMGQVAVAFSGGVDSTFLLKVAVDTLGEKAVAITARHNAVPQSEQVRAMEFCQELGGRAVSLEIDEMQVPGFSENPPERCYLCKKAIFERIQEAAATCFTDEYLKDWFIAEGSNMDDQGDYRPGMKAIQELQVRSPLMEAGLYKSEIRELSHMLSLPTWNLPSFACLASRFVYWERITPEKLKQVELAEDYLRAFGFKQYRVRMHGNLARIEVLPEEIEKLFLHSSEICEYLSKLGFTYITMDLKGFESGSMNKALENKS